MTWKDVERRYAKELDGVRIPVTGRGGQSDVRSDIYSVEIKMRTTLPKWMRELVTRIGSAPAVLSLESNGDTWVLCLQEHFLSGSVIPRLSIRRRSVPAWIAKAVQQSRTASKIEGRIPVVIIHEKGKNYRTDICIIPLDRGDNRERKRKLSGR